MPSAPQQHRPNGKTPRQEYDQRRGSAAERGYDRKWLKRKRGRLTDKVLETLECNCWYCGIGEQWCLDHFDPPSRHGMPGSREYQRLFDDEENLVPCCRDCNTAKGDLLPSEFKMKFPEMWKRAMAVMAERKAGECESY